jgi:hypothetical protein
MSTKAASYLERTDFTVQFDDFLIASPQLHRKHLLNLPANDPQSGKNQSPFVEG